MVDLDVRKLRVLRELDERGTVGAVARALHLTSSAVSQQLAALSRETGVPLLEPVGCRVRLTLPARRPDSPRSRRTRCSSGPRCSPRWVSISGWRWCRGWRVSARKTTW